MPSVDTSLKQYWNFATCLHRLGEPSWRSFLQSMAANDTGIAQKAAIKLLAKRAEEDNESHTG